MWVFKSEMSALAEEILNAQCIGVLCVVGIKYTCGPEKGDIRDFPSYCNREKKGFCNLYNWVNMYTFGKGLEWNFVFSYGVT